MSLSPKEERQQYEMITQMHQTMYGVDGGQAGLCSQFDNLCSRVDKIEKTDTNRVGILTGIMALGTVLYNFIMTVTK